MTRFEALYIKYLRVKLDGSWRWVDGMHNRRYLDNFPFNPEMNYGGNQLNGMLLCGEAMEFLGETSKDGWN